jgi:putative ABC transport system permease protein
MATGSGIRWRKVFRDLASHWFRTLLVIASIAVGVFAIAVVLGGRGVLLREFDSDYTASNKATAQYTTSEFDGSLVRAVKREPGVAAAEGRRAVTVRFTTDEPAPEKTAGWGTLNLWSIDDFDNTAVQRIVRLESSHWPPEAGEVVLEASAKQDGDYTIGARPFAWSASCTTSTRSRRSSSAP